MFNQKVFVLKVMMDPWEEQNPVVPRAAQNGDMYIFPGSD
jgi:hypothetical protein